MVKWEERALPGLKNRLCERVRESKLLNWMSHAGEAQHHHNNKIKGLRGLLETELQSVIVGLITVAAFFLQIPFEQRALRGSRSFAAKRLRLLVLDQPHYLDAATQTPYLHAQKQKAYLLSINQQRTYDQPLQAEPRCTGRIFLLKGPTGYFFEYFFQVFAAFIKPTGNLLSCSLPVISSRFCLLRFAAIQGPWGDGTACRVLEKAGNAKQFTINDFLQSLYYSFRQQKKSRGNEDACDAQHSRKQALRLSDEQKIGQVDFGLHFIGRLFGSRKGGRG